jgi:hypothetical protein
MLRIVNRIYYSALSNGQYDIYRVNILTNENENVTQTPETNEIMPAVR